MKVIHYLSILFVAIFTVVSISQADAVVCDASPDKPSTSITACLAKVSAGDVIKMDPGVYTDPSNGGYETFPLQMIAGITLSGHGAGNTMIYAQTANAIEGDSAGVKIEDVSVEGVNRALDLSTMSYSEGIVLKDSRFAGLGHSFTVQIQNNISVLMDGCEVYGGDVLFLKGTNNGVVDDVRINDSLFIDTDNCYGEEALSINAADVVVTDVLLKGWTCGSYAFAARNVEGTVLIDNLITNGTILFTNANALIKNSRIGNGSFSVSSQNYANVKIASSLLDGALLPVSNGQIKLFQCYDANMDAVIYP